MPDPQPPYLGDALSRFRAAADAAVERGRRAADDARAAGTAFQRESEALAAKLRDAGPPPGAAPTPADLQAAARDHRTALGLPIPDLEPATPAPQPPREDEDFSQHRILRPL